MTYDPNYRSGDGVHVPLAMFTKGSMVAGDTDGQPKVINPGTVGQVLTVQADGSVAFAAGGGGGGGITPNYASFQLSGNFTASDQETINLWTTDSLTPGDQTNIVLADASTFQVTTPGTYAVDALLQQNSAVGNWGVQFQAQSGSAIGDVILGPLFIASINVPQATASVQACGHFVIPEGSDPMTFTVILNAAASTTINGAFIGITRIN